MVRRWKPGWLVVGLVGVAGCVPGEGLMSVAADPFAPVPSLQTTFKNVATPEANKAASERALRVQQQVIQANPDIGVRPLIATLGAPHCEVFHQGQTTLFLTEGLIRKCETDGQLAAVICHEMGKMASEREALAGAGTRFPQQEPPIGVAVGNEPGTAFGPADGARFVELVKYDQGRIRPGQPAPPPPDPETLARKWLTTAGYSTTDQTAAVPLLREAQDNGVLEKQMRGTNP